MTRMRTNAPVGAHCASISPPSLYLQGPAFASMVAAMRPWSPRLQSTTGGGIQGCSHLLRGLPVRRRLRRRLQAPTPPPPREDAGRRHRP